MRLSIGQEQRLVQKQVLAPRMIQSMEILQLPIMALQERIEQELNENPLLEMPERDPDLPDEPAKTQDQQETADSLNNEERELVVDDKSNNEEDFERLMQLDRDVPDHFDEAPRRSATRIEEEGDRKLDAMANVTARRETLQDHLEQQLSEFDLSDDVRAIGQMIIHNLNGDGLLNGQVADLLPRDATEEQLALAHEALSVIQQMDPPGVGARDLRECLLLQLQPGIPHYEEMKTLISGHLNDLADNRLPLIERKTGFSIDQIKAAWAELRRLNPKPGSMFREVFVPTISPDVVVEKNETGAYVIRLEDGRTPSLRISEVYRRRWMSGDLSSEEKEFIKRKVNAAQWLIESIHQRKNTLSRVAQAIVDHQTRFLDEGPEAIEPLKMQQIAEKVGVHVTTVSRAVDDKYIQTPRGIYPLKRFFVGGTISSDGEEIAWDKVRIKLQEVVDNEDKSKPYSDDELVKELNRRGVDVARRTVTKYRQKMSIPSSRQRRDWTKKSALHSTDSHANGNDHSHSDSNGAPINNSSTAGSIKDGAVSDDTDRGRSESHETTVNPPNHNGSFQ